MMVRLVSKSTGDVVLCLCTLCKTLKLFAHDGSYFIFCVLIFGRNMFSTAAFTHSWSCLYLSQFSNLFILNVLRLNRGRLKYIYNLAHNQR